MKKVVNKRVYSADCCTIQYVANYVGVSAPAVVQWINEGKLETLEWLGGSSLLHWPTVLKFLKESGKVGPNGRPWKKVEA